MAFSTLERALLEAVLARLGRCQSHAGATPEAAGVFDGGEWNAGRFQQ
jgi:hypothetical protein